MPDTIPNTGNTTALSRGTALTKLWYEFIPILLWVSSLWPVRVQRSCLTLGRTCPLCMGVHVWVHVYVSTAVCTWVCMYMCIHVSGGQRTPSSVVPQEVSNFFPGLQISCWSGVHWFSLVGYVTGWVRQSVDSALGVQVHTTLTDTVNECSRFKSLCLHRKYLTDWAIFSVPPNTCLIDKDAKKKGVALSARSSGIRL